MEANNKKYKTRISIVIPAYNEESYIEETLRAIKNQICNFSYEIIVVDGQSTDKTISVAKNYAEVFKSPQRSRVFQLNYGASKTSGDLILFLDADTLIGPYFLHKVNKIFEKNKNLFACSARFKYYDGKALLIKLGSLTFTITRYFFHNIFIHPWYFFKTLFG